MSYKYIYHRTKNRKHFIEQAQKYNPDILPKTISSYYTKLKKKFGKQEEIRTKYKRKYEYEYSYADHRNDFIKECRRRYRTDTKANIIKRYYEIRKRFKKQEDKELSVTELPQADPIEVKKETKINFDDLIPINEVVEPSEIKMLQIEDMKKFGYKITDMFLKRHGYNRFEINWLRMKEII